MGEGKRILATQLMMDEDIYRANIKAKELSKQRFTKIELRTYIADRIRDLEPWTTLDDIVDIILPLVND